MLLPQDGKIAATKTATKMTGASFFRDKACPPIYQSYEPRLQPPAERAAARPPLLECHEYLDNTLSFLHWFQSLTDHRAYEFAAISSLHRVTGS